MSRPARRRFLAVSLGGAGALLAGGAWIGADSGRPLLRRTRSSRAFGTTAEVTALHADARTADHAAQAALDALEQVERVMSLYRPDSQLVRLNRTGALDSPDPQLVELLDAVDRIWRLTDGAFDPTVQPLWELYRSAPDGVPPDDRIAATLDRVGWRHVRRSPDRIEFARPAMALTLNGVAQGYATDRALAALRACGVERAILDTGEIGTAGRRESDEPWQVGVQHPRRPDAYLSLARLAGRCLATSGDYSTAFRPDFRSHHVLDPLTGRSPLELASVTVVADSALEADALSTALLVSGTGRGERWLKSFPGAEALFATKDGRVVATPGFPTVDAQGADA